MSLKVLSCCTYLTAGRGAWRGVDYDAHGFVYAVKNRSFDAYVQLGSGGTDYRISCGSSDLALRVFAGRAAAAGLSHGLISPLVLVPVPNSCCDVVCPLPPRTRAQAAALAEARGSDASVADGLRWRTRRPPASTGAGTR